MVPHRFATADSIGHYLGLTPSEYSSGELVQRGPILKCGPGTLRAAMLQCGGASVPKGGEAKLKEMFERPVPVKAGRHGEMPASESTPYVAFGRLWRLSSALTPPASPCQRSHMPRLDPVP